jgi:hypothetical protein
VALYAVATAMFLYRFVRLDLSPFIMDEAYFLDGAGWALASPITGSTPVHYGPAPVWFYGIAQALVGRSPLASIAAMCFVMTLSHAAFGIAVGRALGLRPIAFALLLAFIAASPYQFFWSRLAWNQLPDVCAFGAAALIIGHAQLSLLRMGLVALLLGLGLSAHPISVAFMVAVALLIAWDHRRDLKRLASLVLVGVAGIVLVNVPWFLDMYLRPWPPLPPRAARPLATVVADVATRVVDEFRPASMSGLEYFFDNEWGHFVQALGWPASPDAVGRWLFFVLLALCAGGIVLAIWGGPQYRRLAGLTVGTVGLSAVYFSAMQLGPHPHYNFPVSWVAPAAVALLLGAGWKMRCTAVAFGLTVAVIATVQFSLIVQWRSLVAREGGVRCMHYSTPVGQLRSVVNEACSWPWPVQVQNQTLILSKPIEYLYKTEPLCARKPIHLCGWACPPAPSGVQTFTLRYTTPEGASVALMPN